MFSVTQSRHAFSYCLRLGAFFLLAAGIGTLSQASQYPIEGYPDAQSFAQGDVIKFHVSSETERYHVITERIGATRERVWEGDIENGNKQPIPGDASAQGCSWPVSFSVRVPAKEVMRGDSPLNYMFIPGVRRAFSAAQAALSQRRE